jgi:hypothetical protein
MVFLTFFIPGFTVQDIMLTIKNKDIVNLNEACYVMMEDKPTKNPKPYCNLLWRKNEAVANIIS